MEKLSFETPDMVAGNIEKIGALFPSAITEMRGEDGQIKKGINFEVLKQLLSRDVVDGDECYEFTWVGKKAAMAEAARPITKTLRPVKEDSRDWDTTQNLYVEGDNIDALKLLQESYMGAIDIIYIDPPYNTGTDSFVYPDDYSMTVEDYEDCIGLFDEDGNKLFKKNQSGNPRFHSDWCSMIYSRLIFARTFLSENGVIFISIDDNEYANLKKICDEIFGIENCLSIHHIQVRYADKTLNEKNDWQPVMEYILIYAKNKGLFTVNKPTQEYSISKFVYEFKELTKGEDFYVKGRKITVFKNGEWQLIKHNTPALHLLKDTWVSGSIYTGTGNGTMVQNVIEPRVQTDGYGSLYKIDGLGEDGIGYRYFTGPQKEGANRSKMFSGIPLSKLEEIKQGTATKGKSIANFKDFSADFGNIRHEGGISFNSGKKPLKMLQELINYHTNKNCYVLDFFSGSSSTAHAVMQLNAEDGGKRRFIMVQFPEKCDEKTDAYKMGFNTICELGKERIRRAGDKIKAEHPEANVDTGFRVFRVDSSNMKDVYYHPDELDQQSLGTLISNIKDDRTDLDLLYACLLDWGVEIHLPHTSTELDGCTVHNVDNGALMACFNTNVPTSVVEYMAKQQPLRAVFRDSAFASDDAKINVTEIFKNLSPDTKVKVI